MARVTFNDLKKIAQQEQEEIYSDEAMHRLGPAFAKLKECKDGKAFIEEMERVFQGIKDGRIKQRDVSIHTVIGICQLAHHIREEVSPSRRKSLNRIIPWLLEQRDKAQKKPPDNIVEFILQKFELRNKPAPSNIRPESIA